MNLPRFPEQIHMPASPSPAAAATPPRNKTLEDRDWHASSRDLAQGLVVQEFVDTLPAGLLDLA